MLLTLLGQTSQRQPAGQAHILSRYRSDKEALPRAPDRHTRRKKSKCPEGSVIKVFHQALQPRLLLFNKPSDMCLGSVQWSEGRVGCAKVIEPEEVFSAMIVLSFVCMMFICGREGGICVEERETGMEAEACAEVNRPVWRSMEG